MKNALLVSVAAVDEALLSRLVDDNIGLELSHFANPYVLEKNNLQEDIRYHQELLNGFTLPKSMHGAFYDLIPTARDPKIVEVCYFRVMQSLEIAAALGMKKVVFHTNYIHSNYSDYKNVWTHKQIQFWEKLIPTLSATGISIYLENTQEENATYIQGVIEGLNHPQIKVCYDTGHSHCFTQSKLPPAQWVDIYGNNLGYIHLHSNHGLLDEHIAFTKGTVNFEGFFERVQALASCPDIIIEVKQREAYQLSLAAIRALQWA